MAKFNHEGQTIDVFSLVNQNEKRYLEVTINEATLRESANGSVGISFKAESRGDVLDNPKGFMNSYIFLGKKGDKKPSTNFVNLSNALGLPLGVSTASGLAEAIVGANLKLYVIADKLNEYNGKYYVNYSIIWINPTDFPEVGEIIETAKAEKVEVPDLDWL